MNNEIYEMFQEIFYDCVKEESTDDEQILDLTKFLPKLYDAFKGKSLCNNRERKLLDKIRHESESRKSKGRIFKRIGKDSILYREDFLPDVDIMDLADYNLKENKKNGV